MDGQFWDGFQAAARTQDSYPGQGTVVGLSYIGLRLALATGAIAGDVAKSVEAQEVEVSDDRALLIGRGLAGVLWCVANGAADIGVKFSTLSAGNVVAVDLPGRGTRTGRALAALGAVEGAGTYAGSALELIRLVVTDPPKYLVSDRLTAIYYWASQVAVECGLELRVIAEESIDRWARTK